MATVQFKASYSKASNKSECILLMLIGIPFILVGAGLLLASFALWFEYFQAASWKETPATIQSVEMKSYRGSKGGTTYKVNCTYRYSWRNETFLSKRVFIDDWTSGDRHYWEKIHARLNECKKSGGTIPALVNPQNPKDALLFRELSSSMEILPIMSILFGGAGLTLFFSSLWKFIKISGLERNLENEPEKPWLVDGVWQKFKVSADSGKEALGQLALGIAMTLFVSVFWVLMLNDRNVPIFAFLIIGFFSIGAACCLFHGIYLVLRYLKYGNPTVLLSQFPLSLGESFSGAILIQKHLIPESGVIINLKCEKKLVTGSGKHKHTDISILHEKKIILKEDLAKAGENKSIIPFSFELPKGVPPRCESSNPSFFWKLEVIAETPGIDFGADFDIPVYEVADPNHIERLKSFQ